MFLISGREFTILSNKFSFKKLPKTKNNIPANIIIFALTLSNVSNSDSFPHIMLLFTSFINGTTPKNINMNINTTLKSEYNLNGKANIPTKENIKIKRLVKKNKLLLGMPIT